MYLAGWTRHIKIAGQWLNFKKLHCLRFNYTEYVIYLSIHKIFITFIGLILSTKFQEINNCDSDRLIAKVMFTG